MEQRQGESGGLPARPGQLDGPRRVVDRRARGPFQVLDPGEVGVRQQAELVAVGKVLAQLEGTEQCLSGGRAVVLEVTGEALEGAEERVYDEARDIWVLARRCCYPLDVRPTDEPCSEE